MKQIILVAMILNISNVLYAQKKTPEITDDLIEIRMTLTDFDNQTLQTSVVAEHSNAQKTVRAKSDKNGLAILQVKTGESYKIQIPGSEDFYEYEIPEFAISPVEVQFKFHPRPTNQVNVPFRIFNQPETMKKITLLCSDGKKIDEDIDNGKALVGLDGGKRYQLLAQAGTVIENGNIVTSESGTVNGFALVFTKKGKASLQELVPGKTYLFFKITDPYGSPIEEVETIDVKDECSGKRSQWKTYPNGSIFTEIHPNEKLWLSLKHISNVAAGISTDDFKNDINLIEMITSIGSSKQILEGMHVQLNNFLFKEKLVVVAKDDQKTGVFSGLLGLDSGGKNYQEVVGDKVYNIIPDTITYYQKKEEEILSVLNRNKNKWKNRVIVVDARTSIYEQLKQLSFWRGIEENEVNYSDYVICGNKNVKIKNTNGVRISDSLFNNMFTNKRTGREPSPLIKALIEGANYFKDGQNLILVADASMPVSDLALLNELKVPVKIILCGLKMAVIDPAYFEIAMKTGGSIHTLKEDISDLNKLQNGKTIMIDGEKYQKHGDQMIWLCNQ